MERGNEWTILKKGKVWCDRFDSEDLAYEFLDEWLEKHELDNEDDFLVRQMAQEEIDLYNVF